MGGAYDLDALAEPEGMDVHVSHSTSFMTVVDDSGAVDPSSEPLNARTSEARTLRVLWLRTPIGAQSRCADRPLGK